MVRAFIALDLPESIKLKFKAILQSVSAQAEFQVAADFHLTLKFLGEIGFPKILGDKLSTIHMPPIAFRLSEIGFFPCVNHIRIIWIGLVHNPALMHLQKQIDTLTPEIRSKKEFKPHITLARIKNKNASAVFQDKIKEAYIPCEGYVSESFSLYKSTLTEQGPIYDTIRKIRLSP